MNVILCGYGFAGCRALKCLLDRGINVFVYTHKASPDIADIAEYAEECGVNFSYEKIDLSIYPFTPDVICSIYYRYIIDSQVIESVNGKIFNLHPSLLPSYRGCSSLTWAIINGEHKVGFTYHYIDKGCDTGNILIQNSIEIFDFDTQATLYNRVMFEAIKYFDNVFDLVCSGFPGVPQAGSASYYKRGAPYNGIIDSTWSIKKIKRFIRAMKNPPYPYATFNDHEITTYAQFIEVSR